MAAATGGIEKIKSAGITCAGAFKTALYPLRCLMCGAFFHFDRAGSLEREEKISMVMLAEVDAEKLFGRLMGSYLCPACIQQVVPVKSPLCEKCGAMFKSREGGDHMCEACIRSPQRFGIARACGVYDRALMAAIHAFKYGEKVQLAHPLSLLLMAAFLKYWQHRPVDLIVPVPLNSRRFRKRGFNQAYLLVKNWVSIAREENLPVGAAPVGRHVLQRIRATLPQTRLGRKDRLSNVKKAFVLSKPETVKDRRILIVDDVYTTGATVGECARVLVKGGAGAVDVLTLARTM
jgi:ComF family protein